ncbi:hypothetical protein E2C01_024429 [Portunus trituberculatus]|uniref:Uncharacterized protein n=1 Tax=Portunus trituberculatus TaxID=210409 RepID=A0A5B7EAM4_PORTR|nr:hypothetical protein [Portunus trituberculatus]
MKFTAYPHRLSTSPPSRFASPSQRRASNTCPPHALFTCVSLVYGSFHYLPSCPGCSSVCVSPAEATIRLMRTVVNMSGMCVCACVRVRECACTFAVTVRGNDEGGTCACQPDVMRGQDRGIGRGRDEGEQGRG